MCDIHAQCVTTDRLQSIVDCRFLNESEFQEFDMRKGGDQLQPDIHISSEGDVFDEDGYTGSGEFASKANGQANLWVDLGAKL